MKALTLRDFYDLFMMDNDIEEEKNDIKIAIKKQHTKLGNKGCLFCVK